MPHKSAGGHQIVFIFEYVVELKLVAQANELCYIHPGHTPETRHLEIEMQSCCLCRKKKKEEENMKMYCPLHKGNSSVGSKIQGRESHLLFWLLRTAENSILN